ncbi:hypothetical protein M2103_002491 [Ereboglobus sp. PH5-5]|nr:hypothetical protein [Ereboglobus sp. PH5-5]
MKPELDTESRLFKKPFHVVFRNAGIEFLIPKNYNSKIQDLKQRRYKEIDGEHYLFCKSGDGTFAIDPPAAAPGYTISISHMPDYTAEFYYQNYSGMYEDISASLPDDLQMPVKALSVTPAPIGTISCQLVLDAPAGGVVLMTGSGIPRDDLDEFTALAEYIKPYEGEIPDESDKDAYKANTYHPEIKPEGEEVDEDDAEGVSRSLYPELNVYDAEDHKKCYKGDEDQITVDLKDKDQMRRVLNFLIKNFDDMADYEFGEEKDGEFKEYDFRADDIGYDSEIPFYTAAAAFPELHKKILAYIDLAIDSDGAWRNDEVPKGMNAAYAMAMQDQKYIPKYIQLLRSMDMDHEVYQGGQIVSIAAKWKDYDNVLALLATRACTGAGQHGIETLGFIVEHILPELKNEGQKRDTFIGHLFVDATRHHDHTRGRYDQLLKYYIAPVLDMLEVDYNEQKVEIVLQIAGAGSMPGASDLI